MQHPRQSGSCWISFMKVRGPRYTVTGCHDELMVNTFQFVYGALHTGAALGTGRGRVAQTLGSLTLDVSGIPKRVASERVSGQTRARHLNRLHHHHTHTLLPPLPPPSLLSSSPSSPSHHHHVTLALALPLTHSHARHAMPRHAAPHRTAHRTAPHRTTQAQECDSLDKHVAVALCQNHHHHPRGTTAAPEKDEGVSSTTHKGQK